MENFWNDWNKLLSDFYKVTVYKDRWVQYLEGLGMTVVLAALACLIGVCIGVLVALVKYYAGGKKGFGWKVIAILVACVIKIAGYYIAEGIIYGNWITPASSIPGNLLQVGVAAVVVLIISGQLQKLAERMGLCTK